MATIAVTTMFVVTTRMDAQTARETGIGIDHLILGVNDLDRGMAEFAQRTGITPVKGGVHPGRGTQNALASLGDGSYVEILAPSHEGGTKPDARIAFPTLTPVGWALHSTDLARVVTNLRSAGFSVSEIRPGARARPDGVQLRWQTAEVSGAGLDAAPFFIAWGAGTPHPSTQSPTGCSFRSATLTEPDPAPLTKFLATTGVNVSVAKGDTPHMTIVLGCPAGDVTFR
ncbi:MAG: VOC family protein [Gemmatimonadaceae bacterium]|nr:VOC family protein [Gemmatimonadaceae bacterium]